MNKKDSPIARLHQAAHEIVEGMRKAGRDCGRAIGELRVPIHCTGTDICITIEAGNSIAALNALQASHGKATGAPLPGGHEQTIRDAMGELAMEAARLRDCHTHNDEWGDELDAKESFDRLIRLVRRLDAVVSDMRLRASP